MQQASIKWQDDIPISSSFDEGYFSVSGGLEESSHVFLKGNNLPFAWEKYDTFTIGETGFGTGLNFLNTWALYEKSDKKPKLLYFISVEKEPLSLKDLQKANAFHPSLEKYAKRLHELYPPLSKGVHFLEFENVKLILCFGDIKEMFSNLTCRVNAWYLDGFSPSKNPDMWDKESLELIKNLSFTNATLSTFSVARILRENLLSLGFEIEKKPGFGQKKQMLFASLKDNTIKEKKPWFSLPKPTKAKKAIVLGAGIAGSSIALSLAKRGWEVDVLDKGKQAGCGASGNHCGVVTPLITKPEVDLGRMYEGAFLQSLSWYYRYVEEEGDFCGVKHYAYDKTYKNRWDIWSEKKSHLFECREDGVGRYFDILKAGYVQPFKVCQKLINLSQNIHFYPHHEVSGFKYEEDEYRVCVKGKRDFVAPVLVVALGVESAKFFPNHTFYIQKIRGQVTHFSKVVDTKTPLCADGYICPFIDGKQVIGATYIKDDECEEVRQKDNEENLKSVEEFLPKYLHNPLGGRVSFRGSSSDRFPIIGGVYDEEFYKREYKALPWKKHKPQMFKNASYLPNLYISTAHGSRGLTSAILGANIITAMLENLPLPVETDILHKLHPARFCIRRLQRQEVW